MAIVIFIVVFCLFIGIIKFCLQGSKQYFCASCETLLRGVHYTRSPWGLLLGPFFLVLPRKMTCWHCKSHEVIPANSPRAKRVLDSL